MITCIFQNKERKAQKKLSILFKSQSQFMLELVWDPRPLTINVDLLPIRTTEVHQLKKSIFCQVSFSGL